MKKIISHLKSEWYKYLLEIIVIMIGILGVKVFVLKNIYNRSIRLTRIHHLVAQTQSPVEP